MSSRQKWKNVSFKAIAKYSSYDRGYELVRVSLPSVSRTVRKRILESLLDEPRTVGLLEWWARGSLAKRPWRDFHVVVVREK